MECAWKGSSIQLAGDADGPVGHLSENGEFYVPRWAPGIAFLKDLISYADAHGSFRK
jgi:hypothetical protein